jgi:hypothetical protein
MLCPNLNVLLRLYSARRGTLCQVSDAPRVDSQSEKCIANAKPTSPFVNGLMLITNQDYLRIMRQLREQKLQFRIRKIYIKTLIVVII